MMDKGKRMMDLFIDIAFISRSRLPIKKYQSIDGINFRRDSINFYMIKMLNVPEKYMNYTLKSLCGQWFPFMEVMMNSYMNETFNVNYETFKREVNSYLFERLGAKYINLDELEEYLMKHGIFINNKINLRTKFNQVNDYNDNFKTVELLPQITHVDRTYPIDLNKDDSSENEIGRDATVDDDELKQKIQLKLNELNNIYFNNDDDLLTIDNGESPHDQMDQCDIDLSYDSEDDDNCNGNIEIII
jgi:hypothetical protein